MKKLSLVALTSGQVLEQFEAEDFQEIDRSFRLYGKEKDDYTPVIAIIPITERAPVYLRLARPEDKVFVPPTPEQLNKQIQEMAKKHGFSGSDIPKL